MQHALSRIIAVVAAEEIRAVGIAGIDVDLFGGPAIAYICLASVTNGSSFSLAIKSLGALIALTSSSLRLTPEPLRAGKRDHGCYLLLCRYFEGGCSPHARPQQHNLCGALLMREVHCSAQVNVQC